MHAHDLARPDRNSRGQNIYPTEEGTLAFWRWFGDSTVVDEQGRPLVVYHGTNADFDTFIPSAEGKAGSAIYATQDASYTSAFADGEWHNVMPVYVRMTKPLRVMQSDGIPVDAIAAKYPEVFGDRDPAAMPGSEVRRAILDAGYDGVIVSARGKPFFEVAAMRPEQIKSATGNDGSFDATDDSLIGSHHPANASGALTNPLAALIGRSVHASPIVGTNSQNAYLTGQDVAGAGLHLDTPSRLLDSNDRPIGQDQEHASNFLAWFGSSCVVDEFERPLVAYHGTTRDFDRFEGNEITGWFAADPKLPSERYTSKEAYDNEGNDVAAPSIIPVYLSIQRPLVLDFDMNDEITGAEAYRRAGLSTENATFSLTGDRAWEAVNTYEFENAARAAGYDGIQVCEGGTLTWAIFESSQAKSTIGNDGTFSLSDKSIIGSNHPSLVPAVTPGRHQAISLPEPIIPDPDHARGPRYDPAATQESCEARAALIAASARTPSSINTSGSANLPRRCRQ